MALTTSDEIRKQLTVILGYNHADSEIEVGTIIGTGKLSNSQISALISRTLQFLNSYNALLRDYAGSRLYSVEFSLENLDKQNENLQIMPKSMLFIPGEYKDCNALLLMLSPEMALLDNEKAKESIQNVGELYFEIEEALKRPELNAAQKKEILSLYANRFAIKLQGQALDGKWNRELVGLKTKAEEENFEEYINGNFKQDIDWTNNKTTTTSAERFRSTRLRLSKEDRFTMMQYELFPSTAKIISKKTFELTGNLLEIANTGTIDDIQHHALILILDIIEIKMSEEIPDSSNLRPYQIAFNQKMEEIHLMLEKFESLANDFCKSGKVDSLASLIGECIEKFPEGDSLDERFNFNLAQITKKVLSNSKYKNRKKVRAAEFSSTVLYVVESAKIVLKCLKRAFPYHINAVILNEYSRNLIQNLYEEFEGQRKPVKILGLKYLEKFAAALKNRITYVCQYQNKMIKGGTNGNNGVNGPIPAGDKNLIRINTYDMQKTAEIHQIFKELNTRMIEPFINDVTIEIKDLLFFVEIMLADQPKLAGEIEGISRFQGEITFIWGLVLRASSIQRYLKDFSQEFASPTEFSESFIKFLTKKLGGFSLKWVNTVYQWIREYGKAQQPQYEKDYNNEEYWGKGRIIEEFIEFLNKKVENALTLEGFKPILKNYTSNLAMNINTRLANEIYVSYEMSLDLMDQFPDFIRQTFRKVIEALPVEISPIFEKGLYGDVPKIKAVLQDEFSTLNAQKIALSYLNEPAPIEKITSLDTILENFTVSSFYSHILEKELSYFGNLIARPTKIILKSLDLPFGKSHDKYIPLTQVIDFKYLNKFLKIYIASNFFEIKPQI